MASTQEILRGKRGASGAGGAGGARFEDDELAALRKVLLGREREQIQEILERLDDPATRAAEVAKILPQAIALRSLTDGDLAAALAPAVRGAVAEALQERPDLLASAMTAALRDAMRRPVRWLGRWVKNLKRRERGEARIEQLFLIHRPTGAIIQHALRTPKNPHDGAVHEEQRSVASMVTYLLAYLREPENLKHYLEMGKLRIEQFTYGFHGGEMCVLLSVIRTTRGTDVREQWAECDLILDRIHKTHGEILRGLEEHPELQLPEMLPGLTN